MEKINIKKYAKSDLYYLETIGAFVKNIRMSQNITQDNLAINAGINRTTLSQMEQGRPVNLLSLIQVLRALKQLHVLQEMEVKTQLSPLKLAAIEQKQQQQRQRVRVDKSSTRNKPQSDW